MPSDIDLVIVPCGMRKQSVPAKARALYTGPYFTAARGAAQAMRPRRGWLILSAKHGLVDPDTVLEPYDLKWGKHPGGVTGEAVRSQADKRGLLDADPVVALVGLRYAKLLRDVWPRVLTPLIGLPGRMGGQIVYMNETLSRRGTL